LIAPTKHHLKALIAQAGAVASNVCAQGPNKEKISAGQIANSTYVFTLSFNDSTLF
jgi:hypothetical protein